MLTHHGAAFVLPFQFLHFHGWTTIDSAFPFSPSPSQAHHTGGGEIPCSHLAMYLTGGLGFFGFCMLLGYHIPCLQLSMSFRLDCAPSVDAYAWEATWRGFIFFAASFAIVLSVHLISSFFIFSFRVLHVCFRSSFSADWVDRREEDDDHLRLLNSVCCCASRSSWVPVTRFVYSTLMGAMCLFIGHRLRDLTGSPPLFASRALDDYVLGVLCTWVLTTCMLLGGLLLLFLIRLSVCIFVSTPQPTHYASSPPTPV